MNYPHYQKARAFKVSRRTSGNISLTNTSGVLADVDTGMDITLAAQVGDVIEVGINGFYNDEAVFVSLDVATVVSGSPVNYFGGGPGIAGWRSLSGQYNPIGGSAFRTLVSGDLSSGTVKLRLRYLAGGTKTLRASSGDPLIFFARNLGPADPN